MALQSLPDAHFVSPLLYPAIRTHWWPPTITLTALAEDDILVGTNVLVLALSEPDTDYDIDIPGPYQQVRAFLQAYLPRLRSISKQFSLVRRILVVNGAPLSALDALPPLGFPAIVQTGDYDLVSDYIVQTAITMDQVAAADALMAGDSPPLFESVLFDAMLAHTTGDYRRSLLYATEAIRIGASTALFEADDRVKHTLVDLNSLYRHPVGISFPRLLDELPAANLRSLAIEHPNLYRMALKLYRTEVELMYRRDALGPDRDDFFQFSEEDSLVALQCAIDVLRWFGEDDNSVLPTRELFATDLSIG